MFDEDELEAPEWARLVRDCDQPGNERQSRCFDVSAEGTLRVEPRGCKIEKVWLLGLAVGAFVIGVACYRNVGLPAVQRTPRFALERDTVNLNEYDDIYGDLPDKINVSILSGEQQKKAIAKDVINKKILSATFGRRRTLPKPIIEPYNPYVHMEDRTTPEPRASWAAEMINASKHPIVKAPIPTTKTIATTLGPTTTVYVPTTTVYVPPARSSYNCRAGYWKAWPRPKKQYCCAKHPRPCALIRDQIRTDATTTQIAWKPLPFATDTGNR